MNRLRFDPGLQPERTALAWRRSVLAVGATALVGVRLLPPVLGAWGLAVALGGLVGSVLLAVLAERRARRTGLALADPRHPLPGGGLLLGLAASVTAAALLGTLTLLVVLARAPSAGP